ncbi:MAG: hypothetical protein C7B46_12740, partial [Sulfobacillus benefaciens]
DGHTSPQEPGWRTITVSGDGVDLGTLPLAPGWAAEPTNAQATQSIPFFDRYGVELTWSRGSSYLSWDVMPGTKSVGQGCMITGSTDHGLQTLQCGASQVGVLWTAPNATGSVQIIGTNIVPTLWAYIVQHLTVNPHSVSYRSAYTLPSRSPSPSSPDTVTLSGTIDAVDGKAWVPVIVWQDVGGHWVSAHGNALLDTGGAGLIVSGQRLAQAGMQNNGQVNEEYGVGSQPVRGTFWPGLYVAPVADPQDYIIANQTVGSGLGPAIDASASDEVINIGGEILDQGRFTVNGAQWTWTYTPVSPSGN